jgi:hypothetical protein
VFQAQLAVAGGTWRKDHKLDDWVGFAIGPALGIDGATDDGRRRLKQIIKTWLAEGVLKVDMHLVEGSTNRHPKPFVIPGGWIE